MKTSLGKYFLLEFLSVFISRAQLHRLDDNCLLQFLILLLLFKHLFAHIELLTLSFLRVKWIIIQSRRHNLVQLSMARCCSLWLEANFLSIFDVLWLLQLLSQIADINIHLKLSLSETLRRYNVCDFVLHKAERSREFWGWHFVKSWLTMPL